MHPRPRTVLSLAVAGLTLAGLAAGVAAAQATPGAAPRSATSEPGEKGPAAECIPSEDAGTVPESAAELPAWQTLPITDVDGTTFTLADCIGTPVLVELFATWCPKCREQLFSTDAAAEELAGDAAVLALSVEVHLSPEDVARYQEGNGFTNIRFAVLTEEHLVAFMDAFGTTAANAPSMPKIFIDASGEAGDMQTGSESADAIVEQLTTAGATGAPATTG